MNESVKSGRATLVNKVLGENMEETLDRYFKTVASTSFSWNFILDDNLVSYVMNANEFREFIETWRGSIPDVKLSASKIPAQI